MPMHMQHLGEDDCTHFWLFERDCRRGVKEKVRRELKLVGGIDPYKVDKGHWQDNMDLRPAFTQLVYVPHPSSESLLPKLTLISTQVNHSQKQNKKPLSPWVIALESDKILATHCTVQLELVRHVPMLLHCSG